MGDDIFSSVNLTADSILNLQDFLEDSASLLKNSEQSSALPLYSSENVEFAQPTKVQHVQNAPIAFDQNELTPLDNVQARDPQLESFQSSFVNNGSFRSELEEVYQDIRIGYDADADIVDQIMDLVEDVHKEGMNELEPNGCLGSLTASGEQASPVDEPAELISFAQIPVVVDQQQPSTSTGKSRESGSKPKRTSKRKYVRKRKLYEIDEPFSDPTKEKRRQDAIKAKKQRDTKDESINTLKKELQERDRMIQERDNVINTLQNERKQLKLNLERSFMDYVALKNLRQSDRDKIRSAVAYLNPLLIEQ